MRILVALAALIFTGPAMGGWSDKDVLGPPLTASDWKKFESAFSDFDEVRMFYATKEVSIPKMKDGKLSFESGIRLNVLAFSCNEIGDPAAFRQLLEFDPSARAVSHLCYGLFNLVFYRKGEELVKLHYAHGKYFAPLTKRSQLLIHAWLRERGFPIDDVLAVEKNEANQSSQPTRGEAPRG